MRHFIRLVLLVAFGTLHAQTDTVTFVVDMNDYTGSFTNVHVNGDFNGWCGSCGNTMSDANNDGIWELEIPLTQDSIEFKYTLDGWAGQENLTPGDPCTKTTSGFTNRFLIINGNVTLPTNCYNSCSMCTGAVLSVVDLPITWDDATVNYATTSFGGNVDSIKTDPTNAGNTVLKLDKTGGAQTWAGTTMSTGGLATAIPFTMGGANTISVRVWSPDAGTPFLLKVEDKTNPGIFVETTDTTTMAGAWEVLEFNFNNPRPNALGINTANTYDLISIFPNFGTDGATAGAKTYYVDDVVYGTIVTAMSGIYTIDASGSGARNYATFSAAAADLVSLGVSGAVTFNVAAGSYTDTVYLPAIMGTSATNTITFDGGDSATTSLAYDNTAVNQRAVILMDGADYVSFKGLTITHDGTLDSWGIRMTNDNDNFTLDACRIEMLTTTSTSELTGIGSSSSATSQFAETEAGDNITITNCAFINGTYGVHFEVAAYGDTNCVVSNNMFMGNYYRYYMSDNAYDVTLTGNYAEGMSYSFGYGFAIYDVVGLNMDRNEVIAPYYAAYLADVNFDGNAPGPSTISNNIFLTAAAGGQEGFYCDDCDTVNIYYNSCVTNATSTSAYGGYFNDLRGCDVRNNLFYGTSNYAAYFADNTTTSSTTYGPVTVDYNAYYTVNGANIAYDGGAQATLAAWQGARSNNTNSVSGDPVLVDPVADARAAGGLLDAAATPIAGITTDVDGDMRDATNPDIGADEYTAPSCLPVSALNTVMAYADSATVNWINPNGVGTTFTIEYDTAGFAPGTGTVITAHPDTFITITGLTSNTAYEFYVTADCGAGGVSIQSGPAAFNTTLSAPRVLNCTAGTPGALFSEEFDNSTSFTGAIGAGNGSWLYDPNFTGSGNTGPSAPQSGSHYIFFETSTGGPTSGAMVSPAIDLSVASQAVELTFWLHAYGASIGVLDVGVSTSATGPFTNLFSYGPGQLQTDELDPWQQVGINLDAYLGQTIYIEFNYTRGSTFTGDLAIDLVEVNSCLSCLTPSNLAASNITSTGADITWTSGASNLGSTIEYGISGFTPGNGAIATSTNGSVTLSNLTPATRYDVYVTDSCGATDLSGTAGPISFTTLCPSVFMAPYSTDFEGISLGNLATYENCWTTNVSSNPRWEAEDATTGFNENSSGTGPLVDNTQGGGVGGTYMFLETSSPSGLGDTNVLYSPAIDISPLTNPLLSFYYHMHGATMGDLRVWAEDTGGNRIPLDSLNGQQQLAQADAWLEMQIPLTLPAGVYRFLMEGVGGTSFTSDMAIDDFSILEAPSCFASSGLTTISTTNNSATITWTAGTGTSYDVEYGPAGFTPGTGTIINSLNDTLTIGNLMAATAYDFYVTDSCGSAGISATAGPGTFATSPCAVSEQCVYLVDLYDTFGDGWNGAAITFWQSGVPVGTLGANFATGSSFNDSIVLCDNISTYVTLSAAGGFPNEVEVVVIQPNGDTAAVHVAVGGLVTGDTLMNFTTNCSPCGTYVAPFFESFELNSPSIACWTNETVSDTALAWGLGAGSSGGAVSAPYAGALNAVYVSQGPSGAGDTTRLVSPVLDLTTLVSPQLNFWYAQEDWFGDQNITNVYYRTSATAAWTFLWGDASNQPAWTNAIVNLPNPSATYQIAIEGINNWGRANVVDSLMITDAAIVCSLPDSVMASNITTTNADISWQSGTNASTSFIEYGPVGFTPGTGAIVSPATSVTTLSSLMPGTLYEACVYDICSALGDTSMAACVTFATLCAPINTYPYLEDFDAGVVPPCYSESTTGASGTYTWRANSGTTTSGATGPNVDHTTGTSAGYYMYVEASSPAAQGDSAFLWTAEFDLNGLTNPEIVYYYHMYGADIVNLDLQVLDPVSGNWISLNNIVGQQQTSNGAEWREARVNLAAYNTDTVQFRFLSVRGASFNGDASVDDIIVRETPPCIDPSNLSVVTAGPSSVTLAWDSDTNIIASTIQYGAPGFMLGTGTNVAATPGGFTVSGLAATTCYDFYVLDSCSVATSWVGPVTACTIASCAVTTSPSGTTNDTTDCDGGPVSLTATSSTSNDLAWLVNGIVRETGGTYITDSISFTTPFDVAEYVTTNPTLRIGPLTNIATAGYGNFTNGQYINVMDTVYIDSMTVNHTNDVTAFAQIWDASITNVLQRGDTFSTPAGITGDLRVPVNMVLTPGVYFMNVDFLAGAGQLFRATGGASYPYTLAGLMSIDSTNFGDQSRIYYTFDMTVTKACIGSAVQALGVVPGANAGISDTNLVCSSDAMVNMASFLGVYDAGGTWVDNDATGANTDSILDATQLSVGTIYHFSYVLAGVNGCSGDTADVYIDVEAAPFGGVDTTVGLCVGNGISILRNYLSGTAFGGAWVDLDGSGALNTNTGIFNTNNASVGTYRVQYILSGVACPPDTTLLTLNVDSAVSAGVAVSDSVCDDEAMVDLNTFLDASASAGGVWSDLSGSGALSGNIFDATAVANLSSYDFQYKVMSGCGDDSIVVSLYVDDCDVSLRDVSTGFISIYPNPTTGLIRVEDASLSGTIKVEVYAGNGQLMINKQYGAGEEIRLDISEFANGIYTVKVNSSAGLDVKRIMKQ